MPDSSLTVAVVDPSRARAAVVGEGLRVAGIARVVTTERSHASARAPPERRR